MTFKRVNNKKMKNYIPLMARETANDRDKMNGFKTNIFILCFIPTAYEMAPKYATICRLTEI